MRTIEYTFQQDGEFFIGYLNEFPDYQTRGFSKEELLENLKDILLDIETREILYIKKVEKLVVA